MKLQKVGCEVDKTKEKDFRWEETLFKRTADDYAKIALIMSIISEEVLSFDENFHNWVGCEVRNDCFRKENKFCSSILRKL